MFTVLRYYCEKLSSIATSVLLVLVLLVSMLLVSANASSPSSLGNSGSEYSNSLYCGSSDAKKLSKHRKILVIGDSIGNGHGLATPWPELLRRSTSLNIVNHSVSSMETNWGLEQIPSMLDLHAPSDVLVMLGTNDASRERSLDKSLENLQAIIDLSVKENATVFVMTVLPITGEKYLSLNQRTIELNRGIKQLSGARIIDVRAAFKDPDQSMADSLHPNQIGQKLIYSAVLKELNCTASESSKGSNSSKARGRDS